MGRKIECYFIMDFIFYFINICLNSCLMFHFISVMPNVISISLKGFFVFYVTQLEKLGQNHGNGINLLTSI